MKLLALDQALQTSGYAIFDGTKLVKADSFTIAANGSMEKRLGDFWKHLNELYAEYEFDYLAFEDIQQQYNVETFKRLAYCQAAIMLWCYYNDIKYSVLAPSHWRSIIGKGWGKKREEQKQHAIEWVKETYNVDVDSDTADAVCIGFAANQEKKTQGSAF